MLSSLSITVVLLIRFATTEAFLRIKLMTRHTVAEPPSFRQRKLQIYINDCDTIFGKEMVFCTTPCTILTN